MSAEQELPTAVADATAADPVPSAEPPAAIEAEKPTVPESTSEANQAIAEAEVVAPSDPPAEDAQPSSDPAGGEETAEPTATGVESGQTAVAPDADVPAPAEAHVEPDSAKKNNTNGKRRSSAGVPEHKNKKLNRKKSMPTLNLDAKPGDYFWARLKGYPPWPAIICDEEMLPETLLANRPVTAKRPDGTYRPDYEEGGKNVKERTYPIMYLHTNEFSWIPNVDIKPLDLEEVRAAEPAKKSKQLWGAYEVAKENHDLQYFKDLLLEHERALQEEIKEREARAQEKQAKKEKTQKEKRKSKGKADEEDLDMEDVEEGDGAKKPKATKKRKNDNEAESEKPKKTPKTIKLSSKAANGESGKKSKAKQADAAPVEPPVSEEERLEKRKKEVLYFRHRLQKGFLSDNTPTEEVLQQMSDNIKSLEQLHKNIETSIIRATKIHKVFKAILKLDSIPKDDEHHFRDRSQALLDVWTKALAEDAAPVERAAKDEDTPNGVKEDKDEKPETDGPTKEVEAAPSADIEEPAKPSEPAVDESTTKTETANEPPAAPPAEPALPDNDAADEAPKADSKMDVDVPTVAATSEETPAAHSVEPAVAVPSSD